MNSQEIVNYVMNTPNNTNPTILKQMIEESGGGGGGGSNIDVSEQISEALKNSNFVSYAPQTLADEQQDQARENIGFTEENAFIFSVEAGLIDPIINEDGSIFTDESNKIIII